MSAESPRHARSGGRPLTVPSQPPSDRSLIDAVSGFINDVTLSSSSAVDPKDVIQWARFETADINEPTSEGDSDTDISPLLLILGYGSGVQVWLIPPSGEAQEVLSWRQGTVRVLRILPTPQHGDCFASKRPLIALCDSASPGPTFCSLSFISIRGGEQVKNIKFKNPILDVLANKRSVVVSFSERFAVFDAGTLEDRMAITTCYPCPCPLGGSAPINPLALGDRWLAFADKKLNPSKRSSGGCEGEGVTSYTATVLHAAKSLSKGLRGLGETVAHSLAGGRSTSQSPSPPNADMQQPGVVTVLDIEGNEEDEGQDGEEPYDPIVAHFIAHSDAIIALKFDTSGMLLVTADRRGHDFHVFRINPHPCGPSLSSVHHLYILHRGDTTAKVQDIAISPESRWAAISTLRGTTHVFPLSPYGGACGVRTHTGACVVNRLSRFHRSAGLPIHAATAPRAGSPITVGDSIAQGTWYPNPRLPPYPLPTTVSPLAQLRPTANIPTHTITRTSSGRQRLSSLSEDTTSVPLLARARFGRAPPSGAGTRTPPQAAALYLMAANGCLLHLLLHPRPARSVPKEKICDDSPIELDVEPIAQWPLQRPAIAADILAPLPPSNPLLQPMSCRRCADICMSEEERWLSQVEIVTHAGPHRRLWMGPQFVFKTYNCSGSNSSLSEAETVEVDPVSSRGVARSNPVNMPAARPLVPVIVDSGSASSLEHSPSDSFRRKSLLAETGRAASVCDVQLREDLAEAMKEDHGWPREEIQMERKRSPGVVRAVDPLGTVVVPSVAPDPIVDDPDTYTHSNSDEATFRPVVRAPAALHIHPEMVVRPLPRDTTIPVQTVTPLAKISPENEPMPLNTDVLIPVQLSTVRSENWMTSNHVSENVNMSSVCTLQLNDTTANSVTKVKEHGDRTRVIESESQETTKLVENVNSNNLDFKEIDVNKDLSRGQKSDVCVRDTKYERGLANIAERENMENITLPKSNQVTNDIHSTTRDRLKKSPTPKPVISDNISDKTKHLSKKVAKEGKEQRKTKEKSAKDKEKSVENQVDTVQYKEIKENQCIKKKVAENLKNVIDAKETKEVKELKKECAINDSSVNTIKNTKQTKETKVFETVNNSHAKDSITNLKPLTRCEYLSKNIITELNETISEDIDFKGNKEKIELPKNFNQPTHFASNYKDFFPEIEARENDKKLLLTSNDDKEDKKSYQRDTPMEDISKLPQEDISINYKCQIVEEKIKTEEQAWDMLMNEPEKSVENVPVFVQTLDRDKSKEDNRPKSKKNRKKNQDESTKADENSFVEIHAIEEAPPPFTGELVSISTSYEDTESPVSYLTKSKKSRQSNKRERKDDFDLISGENVCESDFICDRTHESGSLQKMDLINDNSEITVTVDEVRENIPMVIKEQPKSKKSKSLSPFFDYRKTSNIETKDVYVINTSEDDFPEIQITRGSKMRKKSPQPLEKKNQEKEVVVNKPPISWSSIAACKNVKKVEQVDTTVNFESKLKDNEIQKSKNRDLLEQKTSSSISLHNKLIELCKRTDIVVAECDAPNELNFVEEHHAVVQDLPPLEPLGFGLDDFNLEVMRDSLLDVDSKITSPICKINIDDILSSIKETTNKAIESSMFNLVDLEKIPTKKEKGFNVIESHKITTQEVKVDDEDEKEIEVMEKSSDEDPSPVLSTDSDKEERRNTGACSALMPSAKQSAKAKKSRRKKK